MRAVFSIDHTYTAAAITNSRTGAVSPRASVLLRERSPGGCSPTVDGGVSSPLAPSARVHYLYFSSSMMEWLLGRFDVHDFPRLATRIYSGIERSIRS